MARGRATDTTLVQHGPPPPPPGPPPWYETWETVAAILLLLAAGAAVAAFFFVWHRKHSHHPTTTVVRVVPRSTVPDVAGIDVGAARVQLQQAKLGVVVIERQAQKPARTVLGQRPAPGAKVVQGSTVTLVVSRGKPATQVPNVVGMRLPAAEKLLSSLKLASTVRGTQSQAQPGTVLAEQPPAGARAKVGTNVVLVVAKAATTTTATATLTTTTAARATTTTTTTGNDYRGMQVSQAVQQIAQGNQQAVIVYIASSKPAGIVVANSPSGSREQLQVSSGPKPAQPTNAPDETGTSASDAQSALRSAGFSVLQVQWPASDPSSYGTVVYQTPTGNLPRGVLVVLYVGAAHR
jgi:beta-lactam-binding protein with PASTA domain